MERGEWYRIRIEIDGAGPDGEHRIALNVYQDTKDKELFAYSLNNLTLIYPITQVQLSSDWESWDEWDEDMSWDDVKMWWGQSPGITPAVGPLKYSLDSNTIAFQHGQNGYLGGEDTYILTTNWESPTPHSTFPYLYARASSSEDEVMSSLIGFEGLALPDNIHVIDAYLSVYYQSQSVNGGDITVHLAGIERDWQAAQTTWTADGTGNPWQIAGAKGELDRTEPTDSKTLIDTEEGNWLRFDVGDLIQKGYDSFILYAEHEGVNKAVIFPSNEYWDADKRPQLTIHYSH